MGCKLTILIASLHSRTEQFCELLRLLNEQKTDEVQIVSFIDSGENTIGYKRNELMRCASGEYVCFFDDDDVPSKSYITNILTGIKSGADCCSLRGVITWNGDNPEIFEHSIKYNAYTTNVTGEPIKYFRYPNHLNAIKTSIAKQFKFPEINFGEDKNWADQIHDSGLIKKEHYIDEVIYHYQFKTNK